MGDQSSGYTLIFAFGSPNSDTLPADIAVLPYTPLTRLRFQMTIGASSQGHAGSVFERESGEAAARRQASSLHLRPLSAWAIWLCANQINCRVAFSRREQLTGRHVNGAEHVVPIRQYCCYRWTRNTSTLPPGSLRPEPRLSDPTSEGFTHLLCRRRGSVASPPASAFGRPAPRSAFGGP